MFHTRQSQFRISLKFACIHTEHAWVPYSYNIQQTNLVKRKIYHIMYIHWITVIVFYNYNRTSSSVNKTLNAYQQTNRRKNMQKERHTHEAEWRTHRHIWYKQITQEPTITRNRPQCTNINHFILTERNKIIPWHISNAIERFCSVCDVILPMTPCIFTLWFFELAFMTS